MKKKIITFLPILILVFFLIGIINVKPVENKSLIQSAPDRILVKYKKQAEISTQEAVKAYIESTYDIHEIDHFSFIDIYLYKTYLNKERTLKELNENPNIEYAEPDYYLYLESIIPNDQGFFKQWGLHNTGQTGGTLDADIDAPEAWDLTTGSIDVIVAVIDTGVDYNHEDLNANMWRNPGEIPDNDIDDDGNGYVDDYYGINSGDDNGDPIDYSGHGTHCAGIIAAVGNNGIGVTGVCWTAKIMALRFFDSEGLAPASNAIKCMEYAINYGAHIMSNSWGSKAGVYIQSLKDAIEAAKEADILFVAAAGNGDANNDEIPHYPASFDCDNIISVTATNHLDEQEGHYGPYSVDVAAPGQEIYSTLPNNSYGYASGTSMATPHVAGLAALIKSYDPTLNWQQIKNRILSGVVQIPSIQGKILTGGRINAYNLLISEEIDSFSLNVETSPDTNAYIEVSPDDLKGDGDGHTNFTRLFTPYTTVALTAPSTHNGINFEYWKLEGSEYLEEQTISLTMDFDHTITAVYAKWILTVTSYPDKNIYIEVSPDDLSGEGNGYTNFTRTYSHGTTATLTAPAEHNGNKFARWIKDGKSYDPNLMITITVNNDCNLEANYWDRLKWQFKTDGPIHSCPAIGSDGTIYFGSADSYLYALHPNGTLRWRFKAEGPIYCSPSIGSDGTIYFGCNENYIYALNQDGTQKWKITPSQHHPVSPAIGSDGTIYFSMRMNCFYAINPDGSLKWEYRPEEYSSILGSPAIASDGTIYFGTDDMYFYAFNPDGTQKWKYHSNDFLRGTPALGSDGTIYFHEYGGLLYALNPNGTKKWEYSCGHRVYASLAIGSDGTIYFCSRGGSLWAINPNGTQKWIFDIILPEPKFAGFPMYSSPVIGSDGSIYFTFSNGKLYALNSNGAKLWDLFISDDELQESEYRNSSPTLSSDGTLYIGSDNGYLYAIFVDSQGLAQSPWPKFQQNSKNVGRAPSVIDNPPSVSITSPSDGNSISGTVIIKASALDDNEVTAVEFYIDDELKSTDTSSPYSYSWDTTKYSNGTHKIKAVAYDNVDQPDTDEISVTVRNCILTIIATSGGTTDPEPGTHTYDSGTAVSITATPDSGYSFSGWTGNVPQGHENDNPITITMDSDKSIEASFIRQYTLTIAAGTGGTTNPSPGAYTYDSGTAVTIRAIPDTNYRFANWSGDASGIGNPITITINSDKSITANFSVIPTAEEEEKKGPCFIATAAYGSPLHPCVNILRDFRDIYFMPSKFGRLLVYFYYKYSPSVADLIAKHKTLKVAVRISLHPLVAFSYSMVHFGPAITVLMLSLIFILPIFLILFFQRKMR